MKDAVGCDMPRGAAKQALIRGFPNGETQPGLYPVIMNSIHRFMRRTRGSETSQYPKEEKSKEIPPVAASERGIAQTGHIRVAGVVGPADVICN